MTDILSALSLLVLEQAHHCSSSAMYGGVFLLLPQRSKHPREMVITPKASTSSFRTVSETIPGSPTALVSGIFKGGRLHVRVVCECFVIFNQSIKGPHKATHGPRRSHIPAPPQGGQTLHHNL